MTKEGVPIAVGGGEANHSAEMERMRNFFMFRGQEGWLTSTAGQATTLDTPGAGIQVMPGAFIVNSRFAGNLQQSYMSRILSAEQVPVTTVPPQPGGANRVDLVVANIEDPYISGGVDWPYPGAVGSQSRRDGPYWNIRVIEGVPANTFSLKDLPLSFEERDWTAIPICKLVRPSNTATVLSNMIVNLRSVINPWSGIQLPQEILDNINLLNDTVDAIGDYLEGTINQSIPTPGEFSFICRQTLTNNQGTPLVPGASGTHTAWTRLPNTASTNVLIPPWATHVDIESTLISVTHEAWYVGGDADVYGDTRIIIGSWAPNYTPFQLEIDGLTARADLHHIDRAAIPSNMRGKVHQVQLQARLFRDTANFNGRLLSHWGCMGHIKMKFREAP